MGVTATPGLGAPPETAGTAGRTSGFSDHHVCPANCVFWSVMSAGQLAPAVIHSRSVATCCRESGGAFFGISGLSPLTCCTIKLSSGFFETNAVPLSPPMRAAAPVESDNPPLCSSAL